MNRRILSSPSCSPFDIDTARALGAMCGYRVRGLAEHLGVSPRHLRRLFTRQLGCPPERWLREERLRVAAQLLLTAGGVKQVAFALAFRNESQFCRDFRAHFECTPTEWAERGRVGVV